MGNLDLRGSLAGGYLQSPKEELRFYNYLSDEPTTKETPPSAPLRHVGALATPCSTTSDSTVERLPLQHRAKDGPVARFDYLLDELAAEVSCLEDGTPSTEPYQPEKLSPLRIELPPSTLLTPRSLYEPFDPGMPIMAESNALKLLRSGSPRTEEEEQEVFLEDFAVYGDSPSSHNPLEMRSLNHLDTKFGHGKCYFNGVLRCDGTKIYVRRVPISALPIGNYNDSSKHTVRDHIWIQSTSKTDTYYRLGQPAREYERFFTPFLWVADLTKHFVDFLEVMGRSKRKVSIHHFRSTFGTWLKKTHGSAPAFLEWIGQRSNLDFRTAIVANISFLHKEAVGVLGYKAAISHPIWAEAWDIDYYKYTAKTVAGAPTVVTPFIYDCFKQLPCGEQLQRLDLSIDTTALRDSLIISQRRSFYKTGVVCSIPASDKERIAQIKPGDTISTPRDTETSGTAWRREVARGFDDVDRWFALVLKVVVDTRGRRTFDVIWYYRPVDTLCGMMKYPWDNELFLSTHCSCEERSKIKEDEVLAVHDVDFGSDHTTNAEFFCRQTYKFEERTWVSLQEDHLRCEHLRPSTRMYQPGETLLVHIDSKSPFSEPCEFITSFREKGKRLYRLRRLLRRKDIDPVANTKPNELVYSEHLIEASRKHIQGPCSVRVFSPSEDIPTPYDRDGVGNFFYMTHRQVLLPDGSSIYRPLEAAPLSLRQAFDPRKETVKLRGLDLFCGGGNFGRGLEDGGGIEMRWANDYDQRAIHTYMANTQDPESFHPFLGSIDDLQRLAIQGRFSKQVPRVGDVDFISAGSPCPGFSRLTNDKETPEQRKNQSLVAAFASAVDLYRPKYAILENVPGIVQSKAGRDQDVFSQLICAMVGLGYQANVFFLDASACGSAQRRPRIFLAVAAPGYKLPAKPPQTHSHPPDVRASGLGNLPNGQAIAEREMPTSTPFKFVSASEVTADLPAIYDAKPDNCVPFADHRVAVGMTKVLRSRMALIPTQPYTMNFAKAWYGMERKQPGSGILTPAEREIFPTSKGSYAMTTSRMSGIYGRLHPHRPLETVVTSPHPGDAKTGRMMHWSEPRLLTVMEARRAQGFRDEEVILGLPRQQYKIVGNSVAREVAVALGAVFQAAWSESQKQGVDEGHQAVDLTEDETPFPEEQPMTGGNKRRSHATIAVEIITSKVSKRERSSTPRSESVKREAYTSPPASYLAYRSKDDL